MPPHHMMLLDPATATALQIDALTSLVIAVICILIYARTSEYYRLTKHEGIKYFRIAFFFLALGHLIQLIRPIGHAVPLLRNVQLFLTVYAGSLAIFSLLYSVAWKRVTLTPHPGLWIHLGALIVGLSVFVQTAPYFVLGVQALVFIATLFFSHRSRKAKTSLHVLYVLLFLSWLANVLATITQRELPTLAIALNLTSLTIIVLIALRVFRKTP